MAESGRRGSAVISDNTRSNRSARVRASQSENNSPTPDVLRNSSSSFLIKTSPNWSTRPVWVTVPDPAAPAKSARRVVGMKLMAACLDGHPPRWNPVLLSMSRSGKR
ncbi:Uncharacterised protein [Mycobacteroides abscessus subsp. abscessus]|nr:Uncharacterised protein [Mycobacteroides abscessus subsp. abscessus]